MGYRKYLFAFKVYFNANLQYRFNTMLNIILWNLSIGALILFYSTIYDGRQEINNYSSSEMINFILIIKLITLFMFQTVCYEVADTIKQGNLSKYLVMPQNYFLYLFFKTMSTKIIELICGSILISILMLILRVNLKVSFYNFIYVIIAVAIGTIISFQIGIIIGLLAFWLEEIFALIWTLMVVISLISGQIIPIDFFPKNISNILEYLPTASIGYFPTKIIIGHYTIQEMNSYIIVFCGWIIVLTLVSMLCWKMGLKKFSAVGT
ncbi:MULTISPECIES: ABC-2 family transporter protein [unclassified Sutcliffiella]|uniref:ABC transporter permease n=1 Tax=unclassified Sutcliffiella TaxID=2837532 RepID=UPI0030CE52A4